MPIPENYADILRELGFVNYGGGWYYPSSSRPHLHVLVESPQMNGGRVTEIVATRVDGSHVAYMRNGSIVPDTRLAMLDAVGAGYGDRAVQVLTRLEG